MAIRKECSHCGALAPADACTCALCGRSVEGLAVFSTGNADSYLDDAGLFHAGTVARTLPMGLDNGGLVAIALGPLFVIGYPLLLGVWLRQPAGSVQSDLVLGLCWLAPEVYLLSGFVKAAQMANRTRSFVTGLTVPALSIAFQLVALLLLRILGVTPSDAAVVYGLHGASLVLWVPFSLFAVGSLTASALGRWMPVVVPGKFQRVVAPQLGCLSLLTAALLLPVWGGLALMRRAIDIGFHSLWVNIAMFFVMCFFAIYWFWPTD